MPLTTRKKARRILSNCPPHESFWVNNGPIIKNLNELYREFKLMGDDTFRHHVNRDKNDFSKWVKDCLGDKRLSDDLKRSKSKKVHVDKLRARLRALKKAAS